MFSEDNLKLEKKDIYLRYEKIEDVSGQKINSETITQILNLLILKSTVQRWNKYHCTKLSTWCLQRNRCNWGNTWVYGYDNISTSTKISMSIPEIGKNRINIIENIISQTF